MAELGRGAACLPADINGDTYPDIFFSNHRLRATLYRNNRNGTFTEMSAVADASQTPGWSGGLYQLRQAGNAVVVPR